MKGGLASSTLGHDLMVLLKDSFFLFAQIDLLLADLDIPRKARRPKTKAKNPRSRTEFPGLPLDLVDDPTTRYYLSGN